MQTHQVQPKNKNRVSRRVGRGGKRGTYSGRGMKGQGSRAGARFQPRVRELFKKYPKLRGYKRVGYSTRATVNVGVVNSVFQEGEVVSPASLAEKKVVARISGRNPLVKILGQGELEKAVTVERCQVSKRAKEKIEKAGGSVH